ncbi:hypothetical protein JOF53_008292 [Crossiella equi]|uniref:DUF4177 domain-containing protein n=1 Tax=Crossiella equi TaxID=130796 RepID=A0ABS5AS77_9PSEU|nr:hypothetical protein [Crossiella equi]MBP2479420.1 hypothetical protein [Crossiella equi]
MTAEFDHRVMKYKFGFLRGVDYAQLERDLNEAGAEGWQVRGTLLPGTVNGRTREVTVLLQRKRV